MSEPAISDLFSALLGVFATHGATRSWTFAAPEPKHTIESFTWSIDPDGYVLIDAITGEPFDINAFLADLTGP